MLNKYKLLIIFCAVTFGGLFLFTHSAAAANSASFISQSVPTTMNAGSTYNVSLQFYNNGDTTWSCCSPASPPNNINTVNGYKLGSVGDSGIWGIFRVPPSGNIAPGQYANFNFTVTAPSTPGTYVFFFRMVQEYVQWFGDSSPYTTINVVTPAIMVNNVTIDTSSILADNQTQYHISATATSNSPPGGNHVADLYTLINYQGENATNYRGYLLYYPTNAWSAYPNDMACGGTGGYAALYPGWGYTYLTLDACTVSISGNQKTVTWTVRFNSSFTTPTVDNDISGFACTNNGTCVSDWVNFQTNFNITPPLPTCSSAAPDQNWTTGTTMGVHAYNVSAGVTSVLFATWSDFNGQDDIVWYPGSASGSTWSITANLNNHPGYGQIESQVYMYTSYYTGGVFCGSAPFKHLQTGTINVNAQDQNGNSFPASWNLTCTLTNPSCPTYNGSNTSSGSYQSAPYDTWTLTPANKPGYDWQVNSCALNTPCPGTFK